MEPSTTVHPAGQAEARTPRIIGAMRNVMWKGELFARIDFDTLSQRDHLFALGPLEGLSGEFVVLDGQAWVARVVDGQPEVTADFAIRAPFAGFAYEPEWRQISFPPNVLTISALNNWFDAHIAPGHPPFFFRIDAGIEEAVYHIMDLPEGTEVTSPDVAHELGRTYFNVRNQRADLLGFYSTEHKGIFTHHDSHTHIHLLSAGRKHLGHLDTLLLLENDNLLYLPTHVKLSNHP